MNNKWIFVIITALLFSSSLFAQRSEGGTPPSFKYNEQNSLRRAVITKRLTPLENIEDLKKEDEQIPKVGYPKRIGTSIPTEIDLYKDGDISELSNGDKIIRYTINAPDALGLMLYYSDFYIPQGGKLFIYNQDKEQVIGAFTHNTNPVTQKYATEAIFGDQLTLEYVISKTSDEKPRIKIEDVSYIYSTAEDEIDLSCMIDINCTQGNDWQVQKRGVVKITAKIGNKTYSCTGSLVNNTNEDKTPYVLSAYHCFHLGNNAADTATSTYIFNFEIEECGDISNNKGKSLIGASFKALNPIKDGSDGALVLLHDKVPEDYQAYYNGWDITGTASQTGSIIHHPDGVHKKITLFDKTPSVYNYKINFAGELTRAKAHWQVFYSSSVTAGGSSGSPIFNKDGLIIGTLSGGSSLCSAPLDPERPDFYGRMFSHWELNPDFKKYLDPTGTGVKTLRGLNYDAISIEQTEADTQSLVVFPSPVVDELNINCSDIMREVVVIDMTGKQIFNQNNYDSSTLIVPTSTWSTGAYNIVVKTSEGNNISEKVIKQ